MQIQSQSLRALRVCLFFLLSAGLCGSAVQAGLHLALDPASTQSTALQQISDISEPLSHRHINAALAFLSADFAQSDQAYMIVRQNNLADRLLQASDAVFATCETLLSVLADHRKNQVWREYCLQKLPLAYSELKDDSPELKERILDQLWRQSRSPETSFSGTALLGLYRIGGLSERERLIAAAKHILHNDAFGLANKVTALQLATLLGDPDTLQLARQWMTDEGKAISLRSSAIASVGAMGGVGDLPVLQSLTEDMDLRIRRSSGAAVQKLLPKK